MRNLFKFVCIFILAIYLLSITPADSKSILNISSAASEWQICLKRSDDVITPFGVQLRTGYQNWHR